MIRNDHLGWVERMVVLGELKGELASADTAHLWQHRLPSSAATQADINQIEAIVGQPLAADHRAFLLLANGWRGFWQTSDLFGSDDFSGLRYEEAQDLLSVASTANPSSVPSADSLFPIAASAVDPDVFACVRQGRPNEGSVVWIAGDVVDRFRTFTEYFDSMIQYNRLELRALREQGPRV